MNEENYPASTLPDAPGSLWRSIVGGFRLLQVRLRFIAVFVLVFAVIGNWEWITGYWQRSLGVLGLGTAEQSVSSGTEYFCPMCPGVHSDWPSQCPVCSMPLVRRTKGEMGTLPDGSLVRMQISPYRLQLGGIATSRVEYRELRRADGTLWSDAEPFRSQPRNANELTKKDRRTAFVCPQHAHQVSTKQGRCPLDGKALVPRDLAAHERLQYQCPLHRDVISSETQATCEQCAGLPLAPAIIAYAPAGMVLAVPQSALIESDGLKVVFQQTSPGVFDAIPVQLGELSGGYYPLDAGLQRGSDVVSQGAFLLDAETRLDPDLAAAYFGADARGQSEGDAKATARKTASADPAELLGKLKLTDRQRAMALRQRVCPVTNLALGSMGAPVSVTAVGQEVQLCCEGCRSKFQQQHAEASRNTSGK